ncbi:MAG: serine hydrolase domain-containing protein [Pseudomonadota bacterium]
MWIFSVRYDLATMSMALVLTVLVAGTAFADSHDDFTCGLDVEEQLQPLGVSGLSAVVVKNGKILCTATGGIANIEENRPVKPDTIFAWASVSKTVTAVAVMQLVDKGIIALDDDISEHLPFPVRNPTCPDEPITIAQLLTHTSSVREDEYKGVYRDLYVEGDSPIALGAFVKDYLAPGGAYYDAENNFTDECPGETYAYSNIGVGLLGHLIEAVADQPFDRYSRERIFDPLGMTGTAWRLSALDLNNVAMPYSGNHASGFKAEGHFGFPTYPDGLLRSPPAELARFMIMFMQFGELDGKRILSREAIAAMRNVPYPDVADGQGLLWYYDNVGSRNGLLGHSGFDPGTTSIMYVIPEDDVGVLMVANGSWNWVHAEGVIDKLFERAAESTL